MEIGIYTLQKEKPEVTFCKYLSFRKDKIKAKSLFVICHILKRTLRALLSETPLRVLKNSELLKKTLWLLSLSKHGV